MQQHNSPTSARSGANPAAEATFRSAFLELVGSVIGLSWTSRSPSLAAVLDLLLPVEREAPAVLTQANTWQGFADVPRSGASHEDQAERFWKDIPSRIRTIVRTTNMSETLALALLYRVGVRHPMMEARYEDRHGTVRVLGVSSPAGLVDYTVAPSYRPEAAHRPALGDIVQTVLGEHEHVAIVRSVVDLPPSPDEPTSLVVGTVETGNAEQTIVERSRRWIWGADRRRWQVVPVATKPNRFSHVQWIANTYAIVGRHGAKQ